MSQRTLRKLRQFHHLVRRRSYDHSDVVSTAAAGRRSYARSTHLTAKGDQIASSPLPEDESENDFPFIPKATWSVKDLELKSRHECLPPEEIQRLAQLSLLDFQKLPADLGQDLANMMHMTQQISDFVNTNQDLFSSVEEKSGGSTTTKDESELSSAAVREDAFVYDVVRGVRAAPLRASGDADALQEKDQAQATKVWNSYLEPQTTRQGGAHQYFSISTKKEDEDS